MLKTFSKTDIGRKRKLNQDAVYTSEQPIGNLPNLFLVADGMGGHNAGDYASKMTLETIVKHISASQETKPTEILANAIAAANAADIVARIFFERVFIYDASHAYGGVTFSGANLLKRMRTLARPPRYALFCHAFIE